MPLPSPPRSKKATLAPKRVAQQTPVRSRIVVQAIALVFLAGLAGLACLGKLPWLLVAFYLGMSVLTLLAYGRDKSAARKNQWRIRENTLHVLGLAGGWPGALFAQHMFRHKTGKRNFQAVFWLTAALNCTALILLLKVTTFQIDSGTSHGILFPSIQDKHRDVIAQHATSCCH
ncbi:MAG: DUF1294 domain-containing protein [Janthinobacterium lividum]